MAEKKALARALSVHVNEAGNSPLAEASWAVHNIVSRHTERGVTAVEKIVIALRSWYAPRNVNVASSFLSFALYIVIAVVI